MQFRINNQRPSPFQAIVGLLLLAVFIVSMFILARFIFRILAWLSPFLLILALILDYRTVTGYFKWVWEQVRAKPVVGVLAILFSVLGFPLLATFLAGKAFLMRSVRQAKAEHERQQEGEYVEYETLDSETLELPEEPERAREKRQGPPQAGDSAYDRLFED